MRNSPIEYRVFKNTAVGAISFVVTLAQTLVLVPVLLKYWGNEKYGLWLTLMAGFNLLQTLDLGHQNYIGNQLNVLYHTDSNQFRHTLGSSVLIAYLLGFLEIVLCLTLMASQTMTHILSVPSMVIAQNQLALGLLVLLTMWLIFGSFGGILVRIMIPAGMLYESQWIGIAVRLTQFFSIVIIAVFGGTIFIACFSYAIIQSIVTLLIFRYIKLKLPEFYPWWRGAQWQQGLSGLRKSLVLTLNSIGQQLSNSGLVILISALFTSAVVPSFTTLRTLTNTAGSVTSILITAILPDMIRFHSTRRSEQLKDLIYANWFISGLCVNCGIIIILPLVESIYRLWTKGYLSFNPALFLLLIVAISVANFGSSLNQYLAGINALWAQLAITLCRVATLFATCFVLSGRFGIVSIGIGCVLSEILASVVLPIIFVNKGLTAFSTRLGTWHVALALVPPASLSLLSIVIVVHPLAFRLISLVMFPALAVTYFANWKILNSDVKGRIGSLVATVVRRFSAP